ncbi:TPR domain-containing protein [Apiospora arundinis]|uniref:Mcm2 3 5 family protein n=1 Tax=Apiospora arundinis TaxID=335852 RepID=A0ABR2JAF6_9PEZI
MADPSRSQDEGHRSSLLPSAFSRGHAYHRMSSDGDIDLADVAPVRPYSPIETRDIHATPPMEAPSYLQPPRRPSATTPIGTGDAEASIGARVDPASYSTPSFVITHQDEPPAQTEGTRTSSRPPSERQTRFTEMLKRSLSSSGDKNGDPFSDPAGNPYLGASSARSSLLLPVGDREDRQRDYETDSLSKRYAQAPLDCHSRNDVHMSRRSWIYQQLVFASVVSTFLSGAWFVVAIIQPRYGRKISTAGGVLAPADATLVTAVLAKFTELTFVTVFVGVLGQILTRRAFTENSKGMTISEMTMRNWAIQPGTMMSHWETIPYAGKTLLGLLAMLATLASMTYTSASDAMVAPKLKFGPWEKMEMEAFVRTSYANPQYIKSTCTTPISSSLDELNAGVSCVEVEYSGQSYRNLLAFMKDWQLLESAPSITDMRSRPVGTAILNDNITVTSSWVNTEYSDPGKLFKEHKRIVNNVTLAMPHPGVYEAAINEKNGILQPNDLSGVGEYRINASVVSPVVNTLCVNLSPAELSPLVYTSWPGAKTKDSEIPGQKMADPAWLNYMPIADDKTWLNRTAVDDIFRWGKKYGRRPPVFPMVPIEYNMITNTTVYMGDSIYILAKAPKRTVGDYTICELRSWMSPQCSTEFSSSGITGSKMKAHCDDPEDENSYSHVTTDAPLFPGPNTDWRNVADQWRLSMDINGGVQNNNASNARIFTNLILGKPELSETLPSMAEAISVLASSTLIVGSKQSTTKHFWNYTKATLEGGNWETFPAQIQMQQYTSSYEKPWQGCFYLVLAIVFILNVCCLLYLLFAAKGMVTDMTEPQNAFALALNSPPSRQLYGSCGHGPEGRELDIPWRLAYANAANHYYFEEANQSPWRGRFSGQTLANSSVVSLADGSYSKSYKRLSTGRTFL